MENGIIINTPFRHVVIDGFLSPSYAKILLDAFPWPDSNLWKTPSNKHTQGKSVMQGDKYHHMTWEAQQVLDYMTGAGMRYLLGKWFGIHELQADHYYAEGGFHRIGRGGFLDPHADFSHHDLTGLERRLNLILYLNPEWRSEWNGALNLYDKDLTPCAMYEPIYNRAVIFETSETSYHGHPEPLRCPENVYRRSLALYYYTEPRPERRRHRAIFPNDPNFVHEAK